MVEQKARNPRHHEKSPSTGTKKKEQQHQAEFLDTFMLDVEQHRPMEYLFIRETCQYRVQGLYGEF